MSAFITSLITSKVTTTIAISILPLIAGPIIKWLLSKIPTDRLKEKLGKGAYNLGVFVTTLLGKKIKYVNRLWNDCIEPWVILIVETIVTNCLHEFIRGLRSDNKDSN